MAYGPRPLLVFPCLSSTTDSEKRHSVTSSREPSPAVEYIERCTTPSSLGRGASPRSWSPVHTPVFPLQTLRPHGVAGDALRSASATSDNAHYVTQARHDRAGLTLRPINGGFLHGPRRLCACPRYIFLSNTGTEGRAETRAIARGCFPI